MLNDLRNAIKNEYGKDAKYVPYGMIERNIMDLFVLKYYCDNKIMSYQEVSKQEKINSLQIPSENFEYKTGVIENIKLLALIQYANLKDLVKEYLEESEIGINLIGDFKKICISNDYLLCLYDIKGNTTYIIDKNNISLYKLAIFEFFDKIFGIKNNYIKYEEAVKNKFNGYDYAYIYDSSYRYRFIKENTREIYFLISDILNFNDKLKVILHTDYKKVSNLKDTRYIMRYMSMVLLYDEANTFVYYEKKKDDKVSIINYNKDKINSLEKLNKIIEINRKQKDILVKTTLEDIKNNCYRIGFRLYQETSVESTRNINEIVDENTRLIDRLSWLNKEIEQEINKLINR